MLVAVLFVGLMSYAYQAFQKVRKNHFEVVAAYFLKICYVFIRLPNNGNCGFGYFNFYIISLYTFSTSIIIIFIVIIIQYTYVYKSYTNNEVEKYLQ